MFQENDDQNETLRNETSFPLFFGLSAFSFSSFLRYNHSSLDLTCSSIYFISLNGRIIDRGYVCFGGPSGLDGSLVAGIWAFSGWRNGLKWMGFGGGPTPMKGTSPSYVGGPVGGPVGAAHAAVQRNARLGWDILIAFKKCMLRISLLALNSI